jgi:hypothetical protein
LTPPSFGGVTPARTALQEAATVIVQWMPVHRSAVTPPLVAAVAARFICLSHVNVHLIPPGHVPPLQTNVMLPLVLSTGDAAAVGPEKNSGSVPAALDHVPVIVHVVRLTVLAPTVSCTPVVDVSVFAPLGDTVTVEATACPVPSTRKSAHAKPRSQDVRSMSRW